MLERGSIWRRWDLHVHTPDTVLNNQFGSWDDFLAEIEDNPDIKVIGVTDYMVIGGYSTLRKAKADGRLPDVEMLLPNIEFRLAPQNNKGAAVNIHVLVSPDDPDHEAKILQALSHLTWQYKEDKYSCVPQQLIALGKAINPKITDDKVALAEGVKAFKIDFSVFRDWYKNEGWLNKNSLIACAAGDDGLSGFTQEGGWLALREEISRFINVIDCGRPGERNFWLGKGSEKDRETMKALGGMKPCIHGSDAHETKKVFKPDQDRFCWIKADTTFEGLKQIMYEPEDRVYIGPTAPGLHDNSRVIREVRIEDPTECFGKITIPLNRVSQRSSGRRVQANLAWPN